MKFKKYLEELKVYSEADLFAIEKLIQDELQLKKNSIQYYQQCIDLIQYHRNIAFEIKSKELIDRLNSMHDQLLQLILDKKIIN